MSKKKLESSSNNSNEFVFFSVSRRFKRFKIKSISHIDISNDKNDKLFSSFNESQSSTKNVDSCQNDSIIAKSNLKKFVKNQNQIENNIDKYIISIHFDDDYNQIDENEKSIKVEILDFDKL